MQKIQVVAWRQTVRVMKQGSVWRGVDERFKKLGGRSPQPDKKQDQEKLFHKRFCALVVSFPQSKSRRANFLPTSFSYVPLRLPTRSPYSYLHAQNQAFGLLQGIERHLFL